MFKIISPTLLFVSLRRICSEFETIRETALKVPENTDEIKQTISFIEMARTKGIEELNGKIRVRMRFYFMLLHGDISDLIAHLCIAF